MVYVDKTAYVDYDKTLLREFSIMCKVRKLTLRNTRVGLRLAAGADSDSRDFRSSGCRGLQFATTAYSMSQSVAVSSCVAARCLFISSFAPPSLSPSLAPPLPSPRRRQARRDEWGRGGEGVAKCWHEKPRPPSHWALCPVRKKNNIKSMNRNSLWDILRHDVPLLQAAGFKQIIQPMLKFNTCRDPCQLGACGGHKRTYISLSSNFAYMQKLTRLTWVTFWLKTLQCWYFHLEVDSQPASRSSHLDETTQAAQRHSNKSKIWKFSRHDKLLQCRKESSFALCCSTWPSEPPFYCHWVECFFFPELTTQQTTENGRNIHVFSGFST